MDAKGNIARFETGLAAQFEGYTTPLSEREAQVLEKFPKNERHDRLKKLRNQRKHKRDKRRRQRHKKKR